MFKFLFNNWFKPVAFSFFTVPFLVLGVLSRVGALEILGGGLFMLSGIWMILSFFVLLFKRKWRECWYTLLFMITIVIIFGLLVS